VVVQLGVEQYVLEPPHKTRHSVTVSESGLPNKEGGSERMGLCVCMLCGYMYLCLEFGPWDEAHHRLTHILMETHNTHRGEGL
jgi:hypothetical protein